ncbi:hypothetical protein F5141DRAFT_326105 [Pisolithus sp. B1]|nr:hypothetical protein F5141DRAFT_326105 [Pisolithus sp. B1]
MPRFRTTTWWKAEPPYYILIYQLRGSNVRSVSTVLQLPPGLSLSLRASPDTHLHGAGGGIDRLRGLWVSHILVSFRSCAPGDRVAARAQPNWRLVQDNGRPIPRLKDPRKAPTCRSERKKTKDAYMCRRKAIKIFIAEAIFIFTILLQVKVDDN